MQAGTCLLPRVYCDVEVMWHIPLPNSSQCFKVSAIFPPVKLMTLLPMLKARNMMSRNYYSIVYDLAIFASLISTMSSDLSISKMQRDDRVRVEEHVEANWSI